MKITTLMGLALVSSLALFTAPTVSNAEETCRGEPWTFQGFLQGCSAASYQDAGDNSEAPKDHIGSRVEPSTPAPAPEPEEPEEPGEECRGSCGGHHGGHGNHGGHGGGHGNNGHHGGPGNGHGGGGHNGNHNGGGGGRGGNGRN